MQRKKLKQELQEGRLQKSLVFMEIYFKSSKNNKIQNLKYINTDRLYIYVYACINKIYKKIS